MDPKDGFSPHYVSSLALSKTMARALISYEGCPVGDINLIVLSMMSKQVLHMCAAFVEVLQRRVEGATTRREAYRHVDTLINDIRMRLPRGRIELLASTKDGKDMIEEVNRRLLQDPYLVSMGGAEPISEVEMEIPPEEDGYGDDEKA